VALTLDYVPAPHDHVVQFYRHDRELAEGVGDFLAEAIQGGGVAVVIATEAHRRLFTARLVEAGIDAARLAEAGLTPAGEGGTLVLLDADEAMQALLIDGRLAPHRFDKLIGKLIREAVAGGRAVRAYGEIVALLWGDGYVTAAVELERLWNDLGREVDFSLYCAYPLESVRPPRLRQAPLELACTFIPVGYGPTAARCFVTRTLAAWGYPELVDNAAVIASELATNAVLHARTQFTVTVSRRPGGIIRVAVRDASRQPPRPRPPALLAGTGRGLGLVDALSAGWGADILPDGKVVWAQLAG